MTNGNPWMDDDEASFHKSQGKKLITIKGPVLIIGGGVAGMTAAISLARQGHRSHLIERKLKLGGLVRCIDHLSLDDRPGVAIIRKLIKEISKEPNVTVHVSSTVKRVDGCIGNFKVVIDRNGKLMRKTFGAIIVATGAEVLKPQGIFGSSKSDRIITLPQYEVMVLKKQVPDFKKVAFIQCAGSRGQIVSYCSKVCCNSTVRKAIDIRENRDGVVRQPAVTNGPTGPSADVLVLYRDIMAYGKQNELNYNKARELGARFIRYEPKRRPEVSASGDKVLIKYYHPELQKEMTEEVDLLVLATPLIAHENARRLSKMLKVPLDKDGFFSEAHLELRPVDLTTEGIFICGAAKGPADVPESITQAFAAAAKAGAIMKPKTVHQASLQCVIEETECVGLCRVHLEADLASLQCIIDETNCIGCGLCSKNCPYDAIELVGSMVELPDGELETKKARVLTAVCKGCGKCAANCPTGAITMKYFDDEQVMERLMAML